MKFNFFLILHFKIILHLKGTSLSFKIGKVHFKGSFIFSLLKFLKIVYILYHSGIVFILFFKYNYVIVRKICFIKAIL